MCVSWLFSLLWTKYQRNEDVLSSDRFTKEKSSLLSYVYVTTLLFYNCKKFLKYKEYVPAMDAVWLECSKRWFVMKKMTSEKCKYFHRPTVVDIFNKKLDVWFTYNNTCVFCWHVEQCVVLKSVFCFRLVIMMMVLAQPKESERDSDVW